MSVSYRIEIERGSFWNGNTSEQWRALVYLNDEVVNCFVGDTAQTVSAEADAAINWHESQYRTLVDTALDDLGSVRV